MKLTGEPSRLVYMGAVLDSLRSSGGTATSKHVYADLLERGVAREADVNTLQRSGESRFVKETRFARKELVDAGLLLNNADGVWSLSPAGWDSHLSPDEARKLVYLRRSGSLGGRRSGDTDLTAPRLQTTTGPSPVCWSGFVIRSAESAAWTYVMRFGSTEGGKGGHTIDLEGRL